MSLKQNKALFLKVLTLSLSALCSSQTSAHNISIDAVEQDVRFLASDELKGRRSFSTEIDKAGDYIADQFKLAGLAPLNGTKSFKQDFEVTRITVRESLVVLNDKTVDAKKVIIASTLPSFNWQSSNDAKTIVVGKDDDFSEQFRAANLAGDNAILLVHPKHEETFNRFKGYINRGLTKLSLSHQAALTAILTEESEVESFNISAESRFQKQKLTNIVGVLPGKSSLAKTRKEMVLYSAHYDHIGTVIKGKELQVYNGADDDASGTSAVINLARYYAKQANNQRTLVFAAFTAEEIGGYGSRYFSQQLDPAKISAMVNIEMIGKPSSFGPGKFWMTGFERSNLGDLINETLADTGEKIHPDPYPKYNLFYRSDNATLARLGVPAHSISSSQMDKDQHYHQTTDTFETLDLTSMTQVINTIAIGTRGLVDGTQTPSRVDVSKVKQNGKIF